MRLLKPSIDRRLSIRAAGRSARRRGPLPRNRLDPAWLGCRSTPFLAQAPTIESRPERVLGDIIDLSQRSKTPAEQGFREWVRWELNPQPTD